MPEIEPFIEREGRGQTRSKISELDRNGQRMSGCARAAPRNHLHLQHLLGHRRGGFLRSARADPAIGARADARCERRGRDRRDPAASRDHAYARDPARRGCATSSDPAPTSTLGASVIREFRCALFQNEKSTGLSRRARGRPVCVCLGPHPNRVDRRGSAVEAVLARSTADSARFPDLASARAGLVSFESRGFVNWDDRRNAEAFRLSREGEFRSSSRRHGRAR